MRLFTLVECCPIYTWVLVRMSSVLVAAVAKGSYNIVTDDPSIIPPPRLFFYSKPFVTGANSPSRCAVIPYFTSDLLMDTMYSCIL